MSKLLNVLSDKLSGKNVRIVLPEGDDARVLTAAVKLQTTDLVSPIVLGNDDKIKETADGANLSIECLTIINPDTSELKADLVEKFVERRKSKATQQQAEELLNNVIYFGTMLVYTYLADGLVSCAAHSTADTV